LFQSQHSCEQRGGLLDVSWARRSNADCVSSLDAANGVVCWLSSQPGKIRTPARQDFRYGMAAGKQDKGRNCGRQIAGGELSHSTAKSVDELLDVSSLILGPRASRPQREA